jgi:hypothetical protein
VRDSNTNAALCWKHRIRQNASVPVLVVLVVGLGWVVGVE